MGMPSGWGLEESREPREIALVLPISQTGCIAEALVTYVTSLWQGEGVQERHGESLDT